MRCFLFLWSNILVLLSLFSCLVNGLEITIEEGDGGITTDTPTTVRWRHEPNDPPDFDFRFVVGQFNDVGLAAANIAIDRPSGATGEVRIIFPIPGRFVIKAVSGSPQFVVIGTSNEVEVKRPAPPVPSSTSTSSSVPSSSTSPPAESSNGTSTAPRTSASTRSGVIAGIVIGTLALILIIGLILFFWMRRRRSMSKDPEARRVSFHPDQMVQRRRSRFMSIGRFTFRTTSSTQADAEQGGGTITPFPAPLPAPSSPATLAPPNQFTNPFVTPGESVMRPLPTPPPPATAPAGGLLRPLPSLPPHSPSLTQHRDRVALHSRALPVAPRTERQEQISARLVQVKDQIRVLKRNSVGLDRVMEDLQKQVHWLEAQSESDWAKGLTDVPPPGFARYMTP